MYILTAVTTMTFAISLLVLFSVLRRDGLLGRRNRTGRKVILDSCALIDGRILDIAKAGFVPEQVIIPAFVLKELQFLADGGDSHKRERARFGLDTAKELTDVATVDVVIDRREFREKVQVDDKLVALAIQSGASLYTTDFNLAKVAAAEGIKVLNVNELSQNMRPIMLPGETVQVKIIQKGSNRGQGVGYAEDGTMIVVDQADKYMGKTTTVRVERMLNTVAGKMIFATIDKRMTVGRGRKVEAYDIARTEMSPNHLVTDKQTEKPAVPTDTTTEDRTRRERAGRKPKTSAAPNDQHNAHQDRYVRDLRRELRRGVGLY